ncbi:MAG: GGDEF domain-containing protein [Calditrichaeota bacterium]|nr:MAG: GGDEF domain-containing protein [Calditrichota bacterium]
MTTQDKPRIVILHRSLANDNPLHGYLQDEGFTIWIAGLFVEIASRLKEQEAVAVFAPVDTADDTKGIDLLRSTMEYDRFIQRVAVVSDKVPTSLLIKAVNRAHVDYMWTMPRDAQQAGIILRKVLRRVELLRRPLEKFSELAQITEELLTQNEQFRTEATSDPLTQLLNRRSFNSMIQRFWERWLDNSVSFAMAMIDLDHFKSINDTYGHSAGDDVLRGIANILQHNKRAGIDFAFRYGGEEFVVVSSSVTLEEMRLYLERLLRNVRATPFTFKDANVTVTFSCGICHSNQATSIQNMINRADEALYKAKENGRNQIMLWHESDI